MNRLFNFVDDQDLCLFFCVKYDSYLITGFVVQSAHFQKLPLPVLFFRRSFLSGNFYRFYCSERQFRICKKLPVTGFIPQNLIGNHFGQHGTWKVVHTLDTPKNQAIGAGAKQPRTLFSARETTVGETSAPSEEQIRWRALVRFTAALLRNRQRRSCKLGWCLVLLEEWNACLLKNKIVDAGIDDEKTHHVSILSCLFFMLSAV